MKFIDKYAHALEAHAINVAFLKDCYQETEHLFFPPVDSNQSFEDFKQHKYRHGCNGHRGWEEVLMEEQEGRCCYCMRRIKSGKLSVEHIVPKALKGERSRAEYANYAKNSPAIRDYVEIAAVFARRSFSKNGIEVMNRMPHITAAANLLLVCKGKRDTSEDGCCCNNLRQDAYMLPIMLMKECDNRVDYDENGLMSVLPEENSLKRIVIALNDDTLTMVRRIWYKVSNTTYSLEEIKSMTNYIDKVILLKKAYNISNFESLNDSVKQFAGSLDDSKNNFYWDLLLSYDWFYDYYKKKRNRTV